MATKKDLTGQKFGRLTVVREDGRDGYGSTNWLCICDCGKLVTVRGSQLRSGHTRSCGCLQKDVASKNRATHKMSRTALFKRWEGMKQRCENPNSTAFKDYGAKGVTVCDEWHNFDAFYQWAVESGYEPELTIERKNVTKGYSPENCTWVTRVTQNRNTTRTHKILDGDMTLTAAEVGRLIGVSRSTVAKWCREEGITTLEQAVDRRDKIDNPRFERK